METIRAAEDAKGLILCVEDEPDLRADIIEELRSSGHEAVGAADGQHALEILRDVRPDLILCDISMPKMDGFELLEVMRTRRADLDDVPFVFLTALNERDAVISGKRAGVDDYLVKPIDFDLMLASVEARIARSRRLRSHRSSAHAPGDEPADALGNGMTAEILDILNFGVVLAGGSGEVIFANQSAQMLADRTRALSLSERLRAGTGDLTRMLHAQLREVAASAHEGDDAVRGMAVDGPDGESELMLVICALPGQKASASAPLAVIFVSDPSHRPEPPGHLLTSLFGLTPAEAQVAHGLVRGQRSADIARDLAISQTTVAFHLRNLFEKTGTNRQADLIALVMRTLSVVK